MLLAEALIIRADIQNQIQALESRLIANAVVQEGEETAEDPKKLLKELGKAFDSLEDLVCKINISNAKIMDDENNTLTALLSKRDRLKQEIILKRNFLNEASYTGTRARGSEIIVKSSVNVSKLQKDIDDESAELRKLDILIQSLNWKNELIE